MRKMYSMHATRNEIWVKKGGGTFKVKMGAYGSMEGSELNGVYILDQIGSRKTKNTILLYRDQGFALFEYIGGFKAEKILKISSYYHYTKQQQEDK